MSTPRILTLTGAPHPRALVQSIDAASGLCVFAWLNADGERVDSGGSVARFIVSWEPGEFPDERVYIEPTDAELATAIANPPAEPPAPRRQDTRVILDRLTEPEAAALTACTVPGIRLLVLKATATGAIRADDPDFPAAVAGLDALGIIAASRWTALLAP